MTSIDKQIAEAQAEWDRATQAYSRYPGAEEWQAFLDCRTKVESLKAVLSSSKKKNVDVLENVNPKLEIKKKSPYGETQNRALAFIHSKEEVSWNELLLELNLTKDQLRHALLKLLKDGRIERVKTGWYKAKEVPPSP